MNGADKIPDVQGKIIRVFTGRSFVPFIHHSEKLQG